MGEGEGAAEGAGVGVGVTAGAGVACRTRDSGTSGATGPCGVAAVVEPGVGSRNDPGSCAIEGDAHSARAPARARIEIRMIGLQRLGHVR